MALGRPLVMHPGTPMFDALNAFQIGRSHMAVITEQVDEMNHALDTSTPAPDNVRILGLLTMEDVIEELIGEPIEDEMDFMAASGEISRMKSWKLPASAGTPVTPAGAASAADVVQSAGGIGGVITKQ